MVYITCRKGEFVMAKNNSHHDRREEINRKEGIRSIRENDIALFFYHPRDDRKREEMIKEGRW